MNKLKCVILIFALAACFNMTAFATENDSITTEVNSFEELDSWTGESENSVDGIYNVYPNSRASMSGVLTLSKSGTKLYASYSTTYPSTVSRIGVKNVRLMYKSTLGLWNTIVTLDDRYETNSDSFLGAFSVTGTPGRTYTLSATHYYKSSVSSESRYNETDELKFN